MTTDVPVAGAPTVVGPGFGALGGNGTLGGGGGLGAVGGLPSITALPAVSPSPLLDVGFQVAGGDPLALDATSATIAELEDQLRGHATTIQTAPQCAPTWTGEAAQAYANLSDLVAAHFHHAANTAADARAALARWSTELHRCQREGMIAVTEAQHWLAEIKTQALALTTAETDTATSQVAVGTAQANLALAHALGPITAVATPRLQADITAAQNALTTAQDAAQAARTKLDQARHELAVWQARGRQAWQDAEHAAETATGTLAPLFITPPPLARLPTPLTPFPPFAGPADPNCQQQSGNTTHANTGGLPGQLRNLAASIAGISPGAAAALLALAKALEEDLPAEEDVLATPEVANAKLQNIVDDLYRGTTNPDRVGSGTTADAVRAEAETGQPTGGAFHTIKAQQTSNGLRNLLRSGKLNAHDRVVAQTLLDDLQNALRNRP